MAVNLGDYKGSGRAELALTVVDDNCEATLCMYIEIDQARPHVQASPEKSVRAAEGRRARQLWRRRAIS